MEYKSPFSLYDFLGYFIPGALFLYLLSIAFPLEKIKLSSFEFLLKNNSFEKTLAFVIFSYILGHTLNYLSSITIERYSIWSIGYPSKYIIGVKTESYFKKNIKSNQTKDFSESITSEVKTHSKAWRCLLVIVIFPVSLLDFLIGIKAGFRYYYTNPVDKTLNELITMNIGKFKNKFSIVEDSDGDYFRLIWHYYYEKFDFHRRKFDNYVALYGFTRTISLVFVAFTWLFFAASFFRENYILLLSFGIICGSLSYVFYLAFIKFYRRFTLEGFMCMVIDVDLSEKIVNPLNIN